MILQSLYDYYQRKPNLAPQGYEWKEIPFIIVIDKDGDFINLRRHKNFRPESKKRKGFFGSKI